MRPDRVAQIAFAGIALTLVAAGLWTVGGPGTGRSEQRDETRLRDLARLSDHVVCVADTEDRTLPDALRPVGTCAGDERFEDPYTGVPYRYERVSDTAFRLCAGFEDVARLNRDSWLRVDPATGCVQFTYVPG